MYCFGLGLRMTSVTTETGTAANLASWMEEETEGKATSTTTIQELKHIKRRR
jgi:hypothetical protein